MDIKEDFRIKKTVRNIEKNIVKETESETLTATLADERGTTISIKGEPDVLSWLESELEVSVHIKRKLTQTVLDEGRLTRKEKPKEKEKETDEVWKLKDND